MILQSERVWMAGQFLPLQLEIEGMTIIGIYPFGFNSPDVDYKEKRIVPGFIDVHTHGAYGYDTNDGEPDGLRNWVKQIPEEGVTSLLPTTVTQRQDLLTAALKNTAEVVEEGYEGAEILGIHLEGPYLDSNYSGVHSPEDIAVPSVSQFQQYQKAAKGMIRYITLAPEHDENFSLTRYCHKTGIVVSMGHSSASYEQAMLAIANGVTSMTHVYNGMTPYHHRALGLVGTALRVRDIYGELICDGCHSYLAAMNNFFTAKGRDYGIMVTDSIRAKHCPPGEHYKFGGKEIEIDEYGLARLKGQDTIAGSTLSMNRGLQILTELAMVPFDIALNACTVNPARCLGIDKKKGKIIAGYDADLVVLEDNYDVVQTYCRGKKMLQEQ